MSRKKWVTYLLSLLCLFVLLCGAVFAVGCVDEPKVGGVEVGTYYCDIDGKESVLELKEDCTFSLVLGDENGTGSYVLNDSGFSFVFNTEMGGVITAEYHDDVITLHYNDSALTFLRKINYTVTFNAQGGTNSSVVVVNGRKVSVPAEPTREGYLFLGWYQDADCKTAYDFDKPVSGNLTLYARWVAINTEGMEFTVTFDAGEGAENPQNATTVNGKLYNLPTPQKEGAEFLGWWVSDYNDGTKLTYKYVDQTLYSDTTLFAVWGKGELGLSISSETISWNAIGANLSYELTIVPPEGNIEKQSIAGRTSYNYDFANKPAGNYTVTVTASNGKSVTGYFKNKALARISKFEVIDDSILVFNTVQNAQKYIINVECGNKAHNHISDNGQSNKYDFSSCTMQEGGIKFTVYAEAEGFAASEPAYYTFDKTLPTVTGLSVDEATGMIQWDAVENATSYILTIEKDGDSKNIELNASTTSYSLKNYTAGEVTISVSAAARGYNNSEIASFSYTKNNLASVNNVRVFGSKLIWDNVDGAVGYIVKIGGETYNVTANEFPLEKDYYVDGKAEVVIQTLGALEAEHSYDSDVVTVYLAVMGGAKYEAGVLSWDYAVGVSRYEVQINDSEEIITVAATSNKVNVALTTVGRNVLKVRCINEENEKPSDWVTVEVSARSIRFEPNAGDGKPVIIYLAKNDPIVYPEFVIEGCAFIGWYTDKGDGGAEYKETIFHADENVTVFAHWESNPYNAIFVVSEKEGEMADGNTAVVYYMQNFKLPQAISKDTTKIFGGWYDEPNGAGIQYTDHNGDSVKVWALADDVELYPMWFDIYKFNQIDVKYKPDENGRPTDEIESFNYSVSKAENGAIDYVTEITIPVSYKDPVSKKDIPVTTVEANGFSGCTKLKVVNIPDTVTNISVGTEGPIGEGSAFKGCTSIEAINVYTVEGLHERKYMTVDGVLFEITRNADEEVIEQNLIYFPYSKSGEYVVPDGTTTIGRLVFSRESSIYGKITKVTIPASVSSIGDAAFKGCSYLEEIVFEDAKDGVTANTLTINELAFDGCYKLSKITLPARLEEINLTGGSKAELSIFNGCRGLLEIHVSEQNEKFSSVDGVLFNKNRTQLLYMPHGRTGSYVVPNGVTTIGEYAFGGAERFSSISGTTNSSRLQEIIIPASVTLIQASAFRGCDNIDTLIFMGTEDDADLTIESYAFYYCNKLKDITLPANLKVLKQYAFGVATTRQNVIVECVGDIEFETGAFKNEPGGYWVETVHIGPKVGTLSIAGVFGGSLKSITVDENNPYYESENDVLFNKEKTRLLYYPSEKAGAYIIPDSVVSIDDAAFRSASALTKVTIPVGVSYIGVEAFARCGKLSEIVFAQEAGKPLTIGEGAFSGCIAEEIILPERVTTIGDKAFQNCKKLVNIAIPSTVTKMGKYVLEGTGDDATEKLDSMLVFDGCESLQTIRIAEGNEAFASIDGVLYGMTEGVITDLYLCPTLCSGRDGGKIIIPRTVKKVWSNAFYGNKLVVEISFDGETEEVEFGDNVFYNTQKLTSIKLPKGITQLNYQMFYNCFALKSVEIPNTVITMAAGAFYNCNALEEVVFADGGTDLLEFTSRSYADNHGETFYYGVFRDCNALKRLVFPQRTGRIAEHAFRGLKNLEEIVFENSYEKNEDGTVKTNANGSPVVSAYNALTEIGSNAFYQSGIKSVALPKNLTKIGTYAFYGNGLTEVEFCTDGALTIIDASAFYNNKIEEVCIPAGVQTIGNSAFGGNAITKLTFAPNSALITIGNSAFNGAKFAEVEIPASVQTIGSSAFSGNINLTSVTFENRGDAALEPYQYVTDLKQINASAFAATSIRSFAFPASTATAITLGATLFQNCKQLQEVYLSKSIGVGVDAALNKATNLQRVFVDEESVNYKADDNGLPILYNAAGQSILFIFGDLQAKGALKEGKFTIASGATEIGNNAFQRQVELKEIFIPKTVQRIGDNAFLNCYSLEKVTFESGSALSYIGASAFANCTSLNSITIPDGVTELYDYTFFNCSSLSTVNLPELTKIAKATSATSDAYTFGGCTALTSITLKGTLATFGPKIFYNCSNLETITLEEGVTQVGTYLLLGCPNVTSITIPKTVTKINQKAFQNSNLTEVIFAEGSTLITIEANVFDGCAGLTSITLPDSLALSGSTKPLGSSVFLNCTGLTSIVLPAGVTVIQSSTFKGCTALETVECKGAITEIAGSAFEDCTSLKTLKTGTDSRDNTVTLPATFKTLGTSAFKNCTSIEAIVLSDSAPLTTISNYAFQNCVSLTDVSFAKVTTINQGAFAGSGLISANLPAVKTFGSVTVNTDPAKDTQLGAFEGCVNLTSFTFGSALATLGNKAFKGCLSLGAVDLSNTVLTHLGQFTFCNSGVTSIILPDTLTMLGTSKTAAALTSVAYTFQGCRSLTSVTFGSNFQKIGGWVFDGCASLTQITLPDTLLSIGNNAFSNTGLTTINIPAKVTAANFGTDVFSGCSSLTAFTADGTNFVVAEGALCKADGTIVCVPAGLTGSYTLPSTVTAIGAGAFAGSKITSLEIPDSVKSIGAGAFKNSAIVSIKLPAGLTSIAANMFEGCKALKTVELGDKVTSIGNYAFYNSGITNLIIPASVTTIGTYAFAGCTALESLDLSETSVKTLSNYMFEGCTSLATVTLPDTLTSLGNYVFLNSGLEEIVLPDSVTSVGTYLFDGCTSLESVTLPNGLATLNNYMFRNCIALKSITLPETVTKINTYAFMGSGLESIDLSNVTTLGTYLFYGCAALAEVTLSDDLVSIGDYTFFGCTSLQSIELPEKLTTLGSYVFKESGLVTINTKHVTKIGTEAFANTLSLETAIIGEGYIGASTGYKMFQGSGLKQVTLPETMTTIAYYMFADCVNLTSITLPSSLTTINWYAFSGCTSLKSIYIPENVLVSYGVFSGWTEEQTIYVAESRYAVEGYWYNTPSYSNPLWSANCNAKFVFNYTPEAVPPTTPDDVA